MNMNTTRIILFLLLLTPASAKVLFLADFETGDLSQWAQTGTRGQNATPRNVQLVTDTDIFARGQRQGCETQSVESEKRERIV